MLNCHAACSKTDQTAALGVTRIQLAVESKLGWIFRRLEHRDTGIDAEVEVVLDGEAFGLLVALQVKAGDSYFSEPTAAGWRYRGDHDHLAYWRRHNLSVILVIVRPPSVEEGEGIYWVAISPTTAVHETKGSWTIEVPRSNVIDPSCATAWMDLAWASNPVDALWRYCRLHDRFIQALGRGGSMFVEIDDWVNKSSGRKDTTVVLQSARGEELVKEAWSIIGVRGVEEYVQRLFPWANVGIDEDFYAIHEDEPEPDAVFHDPDTGGYVTYYDDEAPRPTGMRPYTEAGGGEVAKYRLELTLNRIGRAYLGVVRGAGALVRYPPFHIAVPQRGR